MASIAVASTSRFRRASGSVDAPNGDRLAALTTTRQLKQPTSSLPTVRSDLARGKIAPRDTMRENQARDTWHVDDFYNEGGLRAPVTLSSRKNTGYATIPSKGYSATWDHEAGEVSESNSDDYRSRVTDPVTPWLAVPPTPPVPTRGNAHLTQLPPWLPSARPVGGPPPFGNRQDLLFLDSASESSGSGRATRSLAGDGGRLHGRRGLQDAHRRIRQLRHELIVKRKQLQELRRRNIDLDNKFMRVFRRALTSKARCAVIPMDVLRERFAQLQQIRDEYSMAEVAFEAVEATLNVEESTLEALGSDPPRPPPSPMNMAQLPPPPPTLKAPGIVEARARRDSQDQEDPPNSAPSPPLALRGISPGRYEDIHPRYEELLEAAADRQEAEEYLQDIVMRRENILHDLEMELHRKRVREGLGNQISEDDLRSLRTSLAQVPSDAAEFQKRFGIDITDEELDFLCRFESTLELAQQELDAATETLSQLRSLCLKKKVMCRHPSYNEEVAIFSSLPGWSPAPQDGNMVVDPPPPPPPHVTRAASSPPSLVHPRFPILLSNPSHLLALETPLQALERALRLPKDDPSSALRRAECMKEIGISMLMSKVEDTADFINQWLIHRLRTSPHEAELLLAVCAGVFRVVNLRRWQEEVLYHWRLDGAAKGGAGPAVSAAGTAAGAASTSEDGDPSGGAITGGGRRQSQSQMGLSPRLRSGHSTDCSVGDREGNSVIQGQGRTKSEADKWRAGERLSVWDTQTRRAKSLG